MDARVHRIEYIQHVCERLRPNSRTYFTADTNMHYNDTPSISISGRTRPCSCLNRLMASDQINDNGKLFKRVPFRCVSIDGVTAMVVVKVAKIEKAGVVVA